MSQRQYLLTILQPLKSDFVISKESLAKKIKDKSSAFLTGVFFKGAENSGGNALGGLIYKDLLFEILNNFKLALCPIIHLSTDDNVVKEKIKNSRKLLKSLDIGSHSLELSQAVYTEMETVDVAHNHHQYNTNAVILVGCKVRHYLFLDIDHLFELFRFLKLGLELRKD